MMKLVTRRGRLEEKIRKELIKSAPDINIIITAIDDYEKHNLETIDKLKRKRLVDTKKINGALKQTISAHGPITKELIGSATKRIIGGLLEPRKKDNWFKLLLKWVKN